MAESTRTPGLTVVRETLTDRVVSALRADILRGEFRPGARIRASEASQRYGVSATPFREALQRLVADGLLEADSHNGARVPDVSRADYHDLIALRKLLEQEALRQAFAEGAAEWISGLTRAADLVQEAYEQLSTGPQNRSLSDDLHTATYGFLRAMYSGCPSERLRRLIDLLYQQGERYRSIVFSLREGHLLNWEPGEWLPYIFAMRDALVSNDAAEASLQLNAFLETSETNMRQILDGLSRSQDAVEKSD